MDRYCRPPGGGATHLERALICAFGIALLRSERQVALLLLLLLRVKTPGFTVWMSVLRPTDAARVTTTSACRDYAADRRRRPGRRRRNRTLSRCDPMFSSSSRLRQQTPSPGDDVDAFFCLRRHHDRAMRRRQRHRPGRCRRFSTFALRRR